MVLSASCSIHFAINNVPSTDGNKIFDAYLQGLDIKVLKFLFTSLGHPWMSQYWPLCCMEPGNKVYGKMEYTLYLSLKPSQVPTTFLPWFIASMVAELITLFMPGAGLPLGTIQSDHCPYRDPFSFKRERWYILLFLPLMSFSSSLYSNPPALNSHTRSLQTASTQSHSTISTYAKTTKVSAQKSLCGTQNWT